MQYTLTQKQVETIDLYMRHPAATALITPQGDESIVVAILDDQGTNLDTITIEAGGKTMKGWISGQSPLGGQTKNFSA